MKRPRFVMTTHQNICRAFEAQPPEKRFVEKFWVFSWGPFMLIGPGERKAWFDNSE